MVEKRANFDIERASSRGRRTARLAARLALCLLIAGCFNGDKSGLVQNPGFDRGPDGAIESWRFIQHAGRRSYSFESDNSILVIERIGPERWGQAIQTLSAAGRHGMTLEFSAEVSGDLDDASGAPSSPTGLGVRISGLRPGMPAVLGPSVLSAMSATPEIGPGKLEWTRQRVVFQVPEHATEIQLSVRLTLDGMLRIRNPRLVERRP